MVIKVWSTDQLSSDALARGFANFSSRVRGEKDRNENFHYFTKSVYLQSYNTVARMGEGRGVHRVLVGKTH